MSQELREKAGDNAELLLIEGAGHADCCLIGKVEYRTKIRDLFPVVLAKVIPVERWNPHSSRMAADKPPASNILQGHSPVGLHHLLAFFRRSGGSNRRGP